MGAGSCGLPGEAADAATAVLSELDIESVISSIATLLRGYPPDVKHHRCQLLRAVRLRRFRPDLLRPRSAALRPALRIRRAGQAQSHASDRAHKSARRRTGAGDR